MKKIKIAVCILLLGFCTTLHAEISTEKRAEIERMLELTGMQKLMVQMKDQMIAGMSQNMQGLPEDFWVRFSQKMDMNQLLDKIIPIYDKYYSLEDLRAVNAFYSSPAGKRILQTLPSIMQESMKVGQEWGEEIGKKAAEEAIAERTKK